MPNSSNAEILVEGGHTLQEMTTLTDSGDHIAFNSTAELWSAESGFEADVKPNGILNGGKCIPAVSGTNNLVDMAETIAYLAGVKTTVAAATDLACVRATPTDTHIINSITITAAGAFAVVTGTAGTSFSATRGAAGGPPWIPSGSVEVRQVRFSSSTAAAVTADEIKSTPNLHTEQWDYPVFTKKLARVEDRVIGLAGVDFSSALPQIHSNDAGTTVTGKAVYASWNEPDLIEIPDTTDFVPPETSFSTNSKQIYKKTKASTSSSIGGGSFTALHHDGTSGFLIALKGKRLWFKYKQDALKDPYILCNGYLGFGRTFSPSDDVSIACTISPEEAALEVIS